MVTSWPEGFPGLGTSASRLGARITRMRGGTLKVNVYPRGKLIKSSDIFTAVANGSVDMYHSIEHYWHKVKTVIRKQIIYKRRV